MPAEFVYNLPFAEYVDRPGINASSIKAGRESMKHMHAAMTGVGKEETDAMHAGTLLHLAVLEPHRLFESLAVWEGGRKYGKTWDAFCEESDGHVIVTPAELERMQSVSNAVHANRDAHQLIESTSHEVSTFWQDDVCGACKARLDGYADGVGMVEFKTTGSLGGFWRTAYNLGHHLQLGWHWRGAVEASGGKNVPVHVIVAEQRGPVFDVGVAVVPVPVLESAYDEARELARAYRACESQRVWPGAWSGEVQVYQLPAWAMDNEIEDEVSMEGVE